jgi:hypothetical protein
VSETPKPEEGKKGWLSRWRSKGDSAPETPEPEATIETPEAQEAEAKPEGEAEKKGWLSRLRSGLA